ncbi:alpha/beta hydrolase [Flavobacterium selenitireducens]|uniref:alpha/beta hydrolase n=1 Tax=Flavobacterium selenitireducens TaxID=2722704 RepID=UPI001CC2F41E|nr:alpha/beta hydrolase [Flavobacterium selenitireducens]
MAISVQAQKSHSGTVSVNGKMMGFKTVNIENRKNGAPILVFESGLGGGTFDPVLPFLPPDIASFQYERNGIGQSEPDSTIISDSRLVERLHSLLSALAIKPPYLLVGHSIGGPYIRLFASKYPEEVCGLVFSDPTDFMLSDEEDENAKRNSGSGTGYRQLSSIIMKTMSNNTEFADGTRADAARALSALSKGYFSEYRDLPRLDRNIGATVIISYNKHIERPDEEMNEKLKLGINFKPWWKEYDDLRILHYADLIKDSDGSKMLLLPKYSHGIYYQDPERVAKLISERYNACLKK